MSALARVRFLAPRRLGRSAGFQRYYLLGLEEVTRLRWEGPPLAARLLRDVDLKYRLVYNRDRLLGRRLRARRDGFVGRYVADFGTETVLFAIDAHDASDVRDEDALGWSDVYFKSNRWETKAYDPKVLPLVNGNGLLDRARIDHLRRLRGSKREIDVAFISNVYGGGREHVLLLFEELARLPRRTDLLAIFDGADPEADAREMAQLRRAGVPVATRQLRPEALWARLARAETVVLRPGRHECVSWRMIDLLCMGACIVLDRPVRSPWPVPLRDGAEYLDAGIPRPADPADYERLGDTITGLLDRPAEAERLRTGAARYFDEHAAPARVAEYILRICTDQLSSPERPLQMMAR